jgi:uncharacterized phage protein (TIGR01671 family)
VWEIKFRVFAKDDEFPNGKMYYPETLGKLDPNRGFVMNQFGDLIHTRHKRDREHAMVWARIGFNDIEIMQYTGLKDIYKDDIAKITQACGEEIIGVVVWDERHLCWALDIGSELWDLGNIVECEHEIEVIGNIYENPELLEAKS